MNGTLSALWIGLALATLSYVSLLEQTTRSSHGSLIRFGRPLVASGLIGLGATLMVAFLSRLAA